MGSKPRIVVDNTPVIEVPSVHSRAMLVNLSLSVWTAKKLDKQASHDVTRDNEAAPGAARVNKDLIRREALAEIGTIASQARSLIDARTAPWVHRGPRILPSAVYLELATAIGDLQTRFNIAADKFCDVYPELHLEARALLGRLFKETDYPSPGSIRRRFSFRVDFAPLPDSADFRVDIGEAQAAAIKAQIEASTREAANVVARDIAERIQERVAHMAEKLRGYSNEAGNKNLFRDSLVENIRELADFIPILNVYGDDKIDAIAKRMTAELCDYTADDLRQDDMARQNVAAEADKILADIGDYLA